MCFRLNIKPIFRKCGFNVQWWCLMIFLFLKIYHDRDANVKYSWYENVLNSIFKWFCVTNITINQTWWKIIKWNIFKSSLIVFVKQEVCSNFNASLSLVQAPQEKILNSFIDLEMRSFYLVTVPQFLTRAPKLSGFTTEIQAQNLYLRLTMEKLFRVRLELPG